LLRRTRFLLALTLLTVGMFALKLKVQPVRASGTIYIRADGSIDPPSANVTATNSLTYTFTGDNYASIVVEKDNIVVDGAGCTVQGAPDVTGIDLSHRCNVTIRNTTIKGFSSRPGIWLYLSLNNTIYGNNMEDNFHGILLNRFSNFNTICENNITDSNACGIAGDSCSDNTFHGNNIAGNYWKGISFYSCSNNTICENSLANNGDEGIYLGPGCRFNTIGENDITENSYGILIEGSNNRVFTNNLTHNQYGGIFVSGSSNNAIVGNNISNPLGACIVLSNTSHNTVADNTLVQGSFGGLNIAGSSYNTVTDNNIADNADGIYLADSSNNVVVRNRVTNNGRGVFLTNSSDNKFYHNCFDSNSHQVYMNPGLVNIWDDGYPSGGNYWSNHICAGNPNDGSQPYILDEDNIDHYPFQKLEGWIHYPVADVNRDGKVDIQDLGIVALAFGSYPEHPRWNRDTDVNDDGRTDLKDIALVALHFGETY